MPIASAVVLLSGCYSGLDPETSGLDEAVVAADPAPGVLAVLDAEEGADGIVATYTAAQAGFELRTVRRVAEGDADGFWVLPAVHTADGTAVTLDWLSELDADEREAWIGLLSGAHDALADAALEDEDLETDRRSLVAALEHLASEASAPGESEIEYRGGQAIHWVQRSDYPFTESFWFGHSGDPECPTWSMNQTIVFEWANAHEAFVDWHATSYYVYGSLPVRAGWLYGYGGPQFFSGGGDVVEDYWSWDWGATYWQWVGATVPVAGHDTVVFEKHYFTDFGFTGYCDGWDQAITVLY